MAQEVESLICPALLSHRTPSAHTLQPHGCPSIGGSVTMCLWLTLIKLKALFWTSPWSVLQIVT